MAVEWEPSAFVGGFRFARARMQTGDFIEFAVPSEILRAEQRNYSIYVSGKWRLTQGDGHTIDYDAPAYGPRDVGAVLTPPKVIVTCTSGPGSYFCIEPTDGAAKWTRLALVGLADEFAVTRDHILFIAAGSAIVNGQPFGPGSIIPVVKRRAIAVKKNADTVGLVMGLVK